jgi:NADH-quinone oxidoreductase subunit F
VLKDGSDPIFRDLDSVTKSAPCQMICPINTKVPTYVSLLNRRRFEQAWDIIKLDNPLPSACARVCHHPCQTQCQANKWEGPVSIRVLKRVATDYAMEKGLMAPAGPKGAPSGEAVGIVGAGPAGLAAADGLADKGYRVTVFDRLEAPGGAMAACIPAYRLPNEILDQDVQNILHKGVELKLNVEIGKDISLAELRKQFKAVFLSTGCHQSKRMRIPDEDAEGVLYSMQFLNDKNLDRNRIGVGRRVGIIGGGNAAMDAARVAKRQPGCEEVTLIYRRTRNEMPAFEEEIEAALDEGVVMLPLTNPAKIRVEDGRMTGVVCLKMKLGEPDDSGRRRPLPVEGSEFIVELDNLIIAIGEDTDVSYLGKGHGLELTRWNTLVTDEEHCTTDVEGVFAGGDVVTGPKTVIEAIAAGKRAARAMDQYIRGEELATGFLLPDTTMYRRPELKLTWR